MGCVRQACMVGLAMATVAASSQGRRYSDAQADGFAGPIRSVATVSETTGVKWQQPGGPTLLLPIWCADCQYDSDGMKTLSGQIVDGKFFGTQIEIIRDRDGKPTERFVRDSSSGELATHDKIGPYGRIETIVYMAGKPVSHQIFHYDSYGRLDEWTTFDGNEIQIGRVLQRRDKDGNLLEETVWDANGKVNRRQTYDPETRVEDFTTYDPSGAVNLKWTVADGRLKSFWETRNSPQQFGDNFTEDAANGDRENYSCRSDGHCEVARVHYEYLDGDKRNPTVAEWRDAEGNLLYAVYCEYETDSFHNWTQRKVSVITPDLAERTLYETDTRTMIYWPK